MKIRMIENRTGSPDGFALRTYKAGIEYDAPDEMAIDFIRKGWAANMEPKQTMGDIMAELNAEWRARA